MKRLILMLLIPVFLVGCSGRSKPKDIVVKINNYEISKAEFEQEFKDSSFGRVNTPESRKEFLDNLINRILILQDAENKGLDNDPKFLKIIEKFWVQSLLKLALEKKSQELVRVSLVSNTAVNEAYQKMLKDGKTTKSYEEMYKVIKWDLLKQKEVQMTNDWLIGLYKDANIEVNKDLIFSHKGGKDGK